VIFNLEFKANSTGLAVVTRMRDKKQLCFVKNRGRSRERDREQFLQ